MYIIQDALFHRTWLVIDHGLIVDSFSTMSEAKTFYPNASIITDDKYNDAE